MPDFTLFLNAIFDGNEGHLLVDRGGEPVAEPLADLLADPAGAMILPTMPDGRVALVYKELEGVSSDAWKEHACAPTAALFRAYGDGPTGKLISFYALEKAVSVAEAEALGAAMGTDFAAALPLPGQRGWELAHVQPDRFYTLEALTKAFVTATEEAPRCWGDAQLYPPEYDPETDPRMATPYKITLGSKADSMRWTTKDIRLGDIFALTSTHKVGPKGGNGIVCGELIGERRKAQAMKNLTVLGLDLDSGVPKETLVERLKSASYLTSFYSTHSHMSTTSDFAKSAVVRYAQAHNHDPENITAELMQCFLRHQGKLEEYIIDSVHSVTEDQTENGFIVRVEHAPIPKWRVIFPLAEACVMNQVAPTQKEAFATWKKIVTVQARNLGLRLDPSGVDTSRFFYLPRHKKGAPYECGLVDGELLDWRTLELDDPYLTAGAEMMGGGKGKGKSVTPEGRALGGWAARVATGFQIVDALRDHCPELIRAEVTNGVEIECPFDEDHSNAGDPDDRACLAVNAGDGPSEVFTVSCRHGSCEGKTMLDMTAKLIKDGRLPRSVLDNEQYNALASDSVSETPPPTTSGDFKAEIEAMPDSARKSSMLKAIAVCAPRQRLLPMIKDKNYFSCVEALADYLKPRLAVVNVEGKTTYITFEDGRYYQRSRRELMDYFEGMSVEVQTKDKTTLKRAIPVFLASGEAQTFSYIDCDPKDQGGSACFNQWSGIATRPQRRAAKRILRHIEKYICADDVEVYDLVLDYIAHMFQRPWEKPGYAVVLRGGKGIGKSTLATLLMKLIGAAHSIKISNSDHLFGKFNAHLWGKLLIVVEEVVWGGNKRDEGKLKDAISSQTQMTEAKYGVASERRSFARIMMITNEAYAVPASGDERRFLFLDASDPCAGEPASARKAYFDALYDEIEDGGAEGFLALMLERDISGFNRFAPKTTAGLVDQVEHSLSDGERWMRDVLDRGRFTTREGQAIGGFWELDGALDLDTSELAEAFESHVRRHGGSANGTNAAVRALKAVAPVDHVPERKRHSGRDRDYYYRLAPRRLWQARFTERFGITFEDEPATDHAEVTPPKAERSNVVVLPAVRRRV